MSSADDEIYAVGSGTEAAWPTVTATNYTEWTTSVRKLLHSYGDCGKAIFRGRPHVDLKPARQSEWSYTVINPTTQEEVLITEYWANDPSGNLRRWEGLVEAHTKRMLLFKKYNEKLWSKLLYSISPDLLRRITLRSELWEPVLAVGDAYELWNLIGLMCNQTSKENAQVTLSRFTALRWNPRKLTLTEFLTKFDAIVLALVVWSRPNTKIR